MAKIRIMKRLSPDIVNNKRIYGFDVETYQTKKNGYIKQDFLMGSVVGDELNRVFWDKEEMSEFLVSRKFNRSMIFATNLEFDFMHVFQNTKLLNNFFFIDRNGLIYAKYNNDIQFIDTWNYTGKLSVDKMGRLLNIEKLNKPMCFTRKPKTFWEKQELTEYNLRDSEITQKFAKFIQRFCNDMKIKHKITLASMGLDYWRRNFQPIDIFQEKRSILEKHYNAFHGGRTEVIKRGYFEDIFYYDYNSHYPARCFYGIDGKGSFPNPNFSHYSKSISIGIIERFEGITKVDIKCNDMYIPLLGITIDNKYIFPKGIIKEKWFTNIELRKALELGYEIIKIYEGVYYTEIFKPFVGCVQKLYQLRKENKLKNNSIMEQMLKLIMNGGLFGKFGQKIDDKTSMFSVDNLYADDKGYAYILDNDKKRKLDNYIIRGNFIFEKKKNNHIPVFVNPIISSYVSSLGRLKLYDDLLRYQDHIIYYDTDSLFSLKNCFSHSKELGELKLEYIIDEAVFIKPKFYYIKPKDSEYIFKTKGVGKFVNSLDGFNNLLKNNVVETNRFSKIKESGVRKIPFSSIIKVNKNLTLEDNKRIWDHRFNPQKLEDSQAITI